MRSITVPMVMTLLATSLASPLPDTLIPRAEYTIAFGEQLQPNGINSWVVWSEGITPCGNDVAVPSVTFAQYPCDIPFVLNGNEYTFRKCLETGPPQQLEKSGGTTSCKEVDSKKITCSGSIRDVIKHGLCE